jgi:hypothetical protein
MKAIPVSAEQLRVQTFQERIFTTELDSEQNFLFLKRQVSTSMTPINLFVIFNI